MSDERCIYPAPADATPTNGHYSPVWGSPANFHLHRAENVSPWAECRACGVQRRFHGEKGRAEMNHWFVPPRRST